jgi:hypothetical protein
MKAGDIVRIKGPKAGGATWALHGPLREHRGQVGVIVGLTKRLYIPAAKVLVMGELAEFDIDELEEVNASG